MWEVWGRSPLTKDGQALQELGQHLLASHGALVADATTVGATAALERLRSLKLEGKVTVVTYKRLFKVRARPAPAFQHVLQPINQRGQLVVSDCPYTLQL